MDLSGENLVQKKNMNNTLENQKTVKMKNEKLDEWGYPIHPEYNFEKPEGDFETRIALVIVFSLIIIGIIII